MYVVVAKGHCSGVTFIFKSIDVPLCRKAKENEAADETCVCQIFFFSSFDQLRLS